MDGTDFDVTSVGISGFMDNGALCINVPITDDMALEEDETFTVTLTVTAGNVGNNMTTVTITNDDS